MENFEVWNHSINLPKQLDGIQNEEQFVNIFKNIKDWYWENFSDNEFSIIKEIWNRWCKEYWWNLNKTRLAIIWNRIDVWIFEFRYPTLITRDKEIRKIPDANKQRQLRALEIQKLGNKPKDIDVTGDADNSLPFNWVNNNLTNDENLDGTNTQWPSDTEIQNMLNLKISPFFENLKKEIFEKESFDTLWNKKYVEWFFNECAYGIYELFGDDAQKYEDIKNDLYEIFVKHLFIISQWFEKTSENLLNEVRDKIFESNPNLLEKIMDKVYDKDDLTDYSKYAESEEISAEENKDIDFLLEKMQWKWHQKKDIKNLFFKYKYLSKKVKKWEQLSKEEQKSYKRLTMFFHQWKRLRKLKEIKKDNYMSISQEYSYRRINTSIEYSTGNMKDIKPIAIVENNKQISDYIYWYWEYDKLDNDMDISISSDDKKRLFAKLKEEKKWDPIFLYNVKYLNDDLSINMELVKSNTISIRSVKDTQETINEMIVNLAIKERWEHVEKEKIKNINIRRSAMVCCFRAISKFFDTVNDNGENFASEFEIEDVNKSIEFDETTWIISMSGTIWINKNYIKLYYDTNSGTLEFDNFLNYNDHDRCYKIWKLNWERDRIGIKLPTMKEMEQTANSVNFDIINKLSLNINQYNRMQWFIMAEAVYLKNFKGILWANMEVIKSEVSKLNEKNILKQDIIKTIYSKFYNKNDIDEKLNNCLIISEGNEPEQFKLIKLISDSIENYKGNPNQLMRFRNCINKLDKNLSTNKDLVENDDLLRYLFADNLAVKADIVDSSVNTMQRENEALLASNNNFISYESKATTEKTWSNQLNYYLFLDLLSQDNWIQRIIDLDEFENALKIMGETNTTWKKLLGRQSWILWENYIKKRNFWDLPNLVEMWKEISQVTAQATQNLDDLWLDIAVQNA